MIDRLGRPLGDRSRPRRPPRTAGPTAEHHVRRLGSISLPSCVSHNSLGPRRRIGRPSRLCVCLDDKAAAAAEPRHGDCRGVGTKGLKLAQPRPSLGRKNAFQGQKLRSPLDNRHRGGEREPLREAGGRTEPTHGRGAARGGEGWRGVEERRRRGRSEHGDSGFPLLGRMPFRKWAHAACVGAVCLGKGSQGGRPAWS